ncbi:hypothetical protein [uncultured Maribacter sp.]|uniref:hypothetical protein n=1 Tax=uncultured Maribacter sp. TaxID=431308 RepID=UPI0026058832|nr:hypothetical protein [uncultured Maribacter sp.]
MEKKLFVVKYTSAFGFIKPWTAVRDSETFSQQFLTPSIVEGMEKKLFPELLETKGIHKIKRHRLNYMGIDVQQERTWSKGGFKTSKSGKKWKTNLAIIERGVMIEPHLYLAFENKEDAEKAMQEHLCLCRNEDIILPNELLKLSEADFDEIEGFELLFDGDKNSMFKVGYNRFDDVAEMLGQLKIFGNPIRQSLS